MEWVKGLLSSGPLFGIELIGLLMLLLYLISHIVMLFVLL